MLLNVVSELSQLVGRRGFFLAGIGNAPEQFAVEPLEAELTLCVIREVGPFGRSQLVEQLDVRTGDAHCTRPEKLVFDRLQFRFELIRQDVSGPGPVGCVSPDGGRTKSS